MNYKNIKNDLIKTIPNKKLFNRNELLQYVVLIDSEFTESSLRNLLEKLLTEKIIVRRGRNQYQKVNEDNCKEVYQNNYSEEAKLIAEWMKEQYPLLDYRIWEISWLNEFWNHQIAQNKIFVEVEHLGCEFVYSELSEKYMNKILLKPNDKELYRYAGPDTVIIDRLVSEAPKGFPEVYNTPLEKIIVDLFANKKLRSMVHIGEYANAISDMFDKYAIDQTKLFRYAKRRNKKEEIMQFLTTEAQIDLITKEI